MWGGPRNISTALMRSWGNRPDTFVCDEPFYGYYLDQTGLPHPGADEIVEHHETDWRKIADWLTGPIPEGKSVFYQKQMAHHLLPDVELDWLDQLTSCFLIREPREMVTSLIHFIPKPTPNDTGMPQQWHIYEHVKSKTGVAPIVIDSMDVLLDPRGMQSKICESLGIEFNEAMLSWPTGRRATDGIWAKHWYTSVEKTTGFGSYRHKDDQVPDELLGLLDECNEIYDRFRELCLT